MALIGAIIFFVIFAANVALGSATGEPFLSDIGEMLVLMVAAVLFVVAILKKEADHKAAQQNPKGGQDID
ncbi:hypothetical protein [Aestuariicoccus sp. MJ-SS9]|uniref:hypothetical protein n=1 Tax=Aestuariicoccus sp. MJ-SS9 TaxID=3079855 RepID=UPI00290F40AC|nr:hypothetical protein [Aestuariicoccus sp. MJ-SS9]MDU8911586.1 hypothetical protein [Aestuariicoccus sp. MJ-SS9]